MIIQQKCPICEGHGNVIGGFYNILPGCQGVTSVLTETCRNCLGTGVVYVKQEIEESIHNISPITHKCDCGKYEEIIEEIK